MSTQEVTPEDLIGDHTYAHLCLLLTSEYYLQLIEHTKGTSVYKGRLKNGCQMVAQEIRLELFPDVNAILQGNDTTLFTISEYIENLFHEIAMLKPENIGVVVEMIKKFKDSPREILEFLNVSYVDAPAEAYPTIAAAATPDAPSGN